MKKLSRLEDLYFNISFLILRWEPYKKMENKCCALFMLVGSMKCNRGYLYTAKLWTCIVYFFKHGNHCLLSGRFYTLILKTFPQNLNDVAESELKMAKYRYNVTDSNKSIFDLLNCCPNLAVSSHRSHYTYLYRRNLWLKPLVSYTV